MLNLSIDADEVCVTGTTKDDPNIPKLLPRPWRWSRTCRGYVLPRSLRPNTRTSWTQHFLRTAEQLGVEVEVEDSGREQSEAERRAARDERLDERAGRHETAAERALATSRAADAASRQISDGIPFGQPILVGHHSERRHRRDLERMDRLDRTRFESSKQAQERARLAEGIRAAQERGESPVTVKLRVERNEAEIRRIEHLLEDHRLAVEVDGTPQAARLGVRVQRQEWVDRITAEAARLRETVELDRALLAQMEAEGKTRTWTRVDFRVGDLVKARIGWLPVLRVNAKSVTVPAMVDTTTLPYTKILGHRRPASVEDPDEITTDADILREIGMEEAADDLEEHLGGNF